MLKTSFAAMIFIAAVVTAFAQSSPPPDAVKDLAPSGHLRAAINTGNVVLVQKDQREAMGVPLGHDAGLQYLRTFVEELKANGFVRKGLDRAGQQDAVVAPPASE
jgi:hypothetical protein